jgi:hypothetical protein
MALTAAYGRDADPDRVRYLYGICAQNVGIPVDKTVSGEQAQEAADAIMLCPDHPKVAIIKKGITAGQAAAKEEAAIESDRKSGKFLTEGSYLVARRPCLEPGSLRATRWRTAIGKFPIPTGTSSRTTTSTLHRSSP